MSDLYANSVHPCETKNQGLRILDSTVPLAILTHPLVGLAIQLD
jgi:hypothetical protein